MKWRLSRAFAALLGLLKATAGARIAAEQAESVESRWNGSVLPDNIQNQQLPIVRNPHYGAHIIALGANGSLWHQFQTGPLNTSSGTVPMSDWHCLTPDPKLIFGNSPAVALNADGRIELFVGYKNDSLDLWQMYQTDATNPLAWSAPRAPYCDPSDKSCVACLQKPECKSTFWTDGYVWTTSQQTLWLNPQDKKLRLSWRNFDGHVFEMTQGEPSNSTKWPLGSVMYQNVME
eukprot:TRINITY_DN79502_c0_g1_i1.p1 TRINITY_DN79502_c0_g1~~TRINITY_DN79502_c0_g1_i1.p1  ORF type:complete len:252 (+),score=21.49 TRINITY_DN79502_c0_g1_i1:58-756(+)